MLRPYPLKLNHQGVTEETMKLKRAVITAAGKHQNHLPLQTLIDRDGVQKSALRIALEEALNAGIQDIAVVVRPGDQSAYAQAAGDHARRVQFVEQTEALGYGHAVYCAKDFVGAEPFLHLVGDHLWLSTLPGKTCAQQLVEVAESEDCAVSAVQATREALLPNFGAIGGRRVQGLPRLHVIDQVLEKPTPTEAEQVLSVPGLRAGFYLCFFGMHVLTPALMELLGNTFGTDPSESTSTPDLASALQGLARRERYLAYEIQGQRHDIGVKYGLFAAQFALALAGQDRADVLTQVTELLAAQII